MSKTLVNLSRRQNHRNATTPVPEDIVVPKVRKHPKKEPKVWAPRIPLEGEASSATYNTFHKDPYRTGDGDTPAALRPGCMHAFTLPSVGQRC